MLKKVLQHFAFMVEAGFLQFSCGGVLPVTWHIAKVLALHKPKKASYGVPRNDRSIRLLSNVVKLFETTINRPLMRYVESSCLLSPEQFGFRAAGR